MVVIFSQFIAELASRRALRRTLDGGRVTYRMQLSGETVITVVTDETRPDSPAWVCSESWPAPTSGTSNTEFMRQALNFNRNALHHLPCGIVLDSDKSGYYRLVWWVPPVARNPAAWTEQLLLFGKLTDKAWTTMSAPVNAPAREGANADAGHMIFMP